SPYNRINVHCVGVVQNELRRQSAFQRVMDQAHAFQRHLALFAPGFRLCLQRVRQLDALILQAGDHVVPPFASTASSLSSSSGEGQVRRSNSIRYEYACSKLSPHISSLGRSRLQTSGRSGCPYNLQRLSSVSWTQRTPAGLPSGIPGMGDEIDRAMQQAPHPTRHSMSNSVNYWMNKKGYFTVPHVEPSQESDSL